MEIKQPIELKLRIDWSEMDIFGHVNNVAFMKYVQAARVNFWETIGLTQLHKETNTGVMLASTACSFKKPLFYPGSVRIESNVNFIKTTSFGFSHILYDDLKNVVATAEDVMVMFDFNTHQKTDFPTAIRQKLEI